MEQIKRAVERAKAASTPDPLRQTKAPQDVFSPATIKTAPVHVSESVAIPVEPLPQFNEANLDVRQLERYRIVAHTAADVRSKSFDMLRTQALQAMDRNNWHFLAITSPTAGCGKTVTAINLALSIARQSQRSALLVDMDLQRPTVAKYLGLKCRHGLKGVLEGRTKLREALIQARIENCDLMVLPTEGATVRSSELIVSRNMAAMLHEIRQSFKSRVVIFDMPPMLSGDEVIACLPNMDCLILVTAAGISTVNQITECKKHLQSTELIRLVLNKADASASNHHYYY
jgi:capsular exopolysaccharide synthesis family protein